MKRMRSHGVHQLAGTRVLSVLFQRRKGERIWELITMDTWTITYSADKVKEEAAKISFKEKGLVEPL